MVNLMPLLGTVMLPSSIRSMLEIRAHYSHRLPKIVQNGPKMVPKCPQNCSKWSQNGPKWCGEPRQLSPTKVQHRNSLSPLFQALITQLVSNRNCHLCKSRSVPSFSLSKSDYHLNEVQARAQAESGRRLPGPMWGHNLRMLERMRSLPHTTATSVKQAVFAHTQATKSQNFSSTHTQKGETKQHSE